MIAYSAALRLKYKKRGEEFLEEHIAVKEPITLFRQWLDEALANTDIIEPNGMCLSTANKCAWVRLLLNQAFITRDLLPTDPACLPRVWCC